jgi:AraC family transcriptional regulator
VKTETRSFYQAAVERTVARITETLDEALDLTALARAAALSPFHFHRVFRGMLGETPLEMHRRLRLERAAARLLGSEAAITTIAFDAGYETHEAFTRAFRQAYGTSPSAFRQRATDGQATANAEARAQRGCARPPQIELAAPSGVHFREAPPEDAIRFVAGGDTMNVTIEEKPEIRLATVPHVGPYDRIAEAFGRLGALVAAAPVGLLCAPNTDRPAMIAVYYDDPETTPADQLRSDAGISVAPGVPLPEGLVERRLPAGRYARTTHVGPYTQLGDVWSRFMGQWLPASGHRVGSGSSYEHYRNTPADVPPHELRTDLYLPIA